MRWKCRTNPKLKWHEWFAWHPVYINGENVWLERVQRKGQIICGGDTCIWDWNYMDLATPATKESE